MPICIECRYPVQQLYTTYSKADDRALGRGVRLTLCPRCNKFADKYVEHDFVVLFLDLVLIKPQVYRHLLFNRLGRDDGGFDRSIVRLAILLVLFDVYLTWARVEKESQVASSVGANPTPFSRLLAPFTTAASTAAGSSILTYPIPLQYAFFLLLCAIETLAFHLPIRVLASYLPSSQPTSNSKASSAAASNLPLRTRYLHPNLISTALFVSSCSKLFPVLMVIWDYDLPSSASAVSWAVIINNIAALQILLDCGSLRAAMLAGVGATCRWFVGGLMLAGAGLGSIDAGSGFNAIVNSIQDDASAGGAFATVGRELGKWVGLV